MDRGEQAAEFKRQLAEALKESLTIEIGSSAGGFTMPNERRITVLFDGEEVCSADIDVSDRPEYEG